MKEQKGITLVALIITIIVMLILVAVTISVVINSGILNSAKSAGQKTEDAYEAEKNIAVNIGDETNVSDLEDYVNRLMSR